MKDKIQNFFEAVLWFIAGCVTFLFMYFEWFKEEWPYWFFIFGSVFVILMLLFSWAHFARVFGSKAKKPKIE